MDIHTEPDGIQTRLRSRRPNLWFYWTINWQKLFCFFVIKLSITHFLDVIDDPQLWLRNILLNSRYRTFSLNDQCFRKIKARRGSRAPSIFRKASAELSNTVYPDCRPSGCQRSIHVKLLLMMEWKVLGNPDYLLKTAGEALEEQKKCRYDFFLKTTLFRNNSMTFGWSVSKKGIPFWTLKKGT